MTEGYSSNYEDYADFADYVPIRTSFEDWTASAKAHALENHPDWAEEKVVRFASDIAWLMEGMVITPEEVTKVASGWLAGRNPYNKTMTY